MNPSPRPGKKDQQGFALMMVMMFSGLSLVALSGALTWTSNTALQNDRNNEYFKAAAAAEAGTEKAMSMIIKDFQEDGEGLVYANLYNYVTKPPSVLESDYWSSWQFNDGGGTPNRLGVTRSVGSAYTNLQSQYSGLMGLASTYRVTANARRVGSGLKTIVGAVRQEFQLANIPIFQFAIFYGINMEISCGQPMNVTGRVHSNKDVYVCPDSALTFWGDVTSAGNIRFGRAPGDGRGPPAGTVTYKAAHDSKVSTLTLPIGTNNTPQAIRAILEPPPVTEPANSPMGKQRYFNKADLIITATNTLTFTKTTNSGIITTNWSTNYLIYATSGRADNFVTTISSNDLTKFAKISSSFKDAREGKTVKPVDIDVAKLKTWSETNATLRPILGDRDVRTIYVNDGRDLLGSQYLPAVRMTNGATLPSLGLTVATDRPVYIQGHYNATGTALGSTNTSTTKGASIVADAITILSGNWTDGNSTAALSSRNAKTNTVNAALLAGIVETPSYNVYSGGTENYQRFLETWGSGRTYTYNGSMVILFPSKYATNKWGMSGVYTPPPRNWSFDNNFTDATRLPPGTPEIRALIRGQWAHVTPGPVPAN